jgi:hypothetical protein
MRWYVSRFTASRACFLAASVILALAVVRGDASAQASLLVTVLAPAKGPVADLTAKDFKVSDGKQTIAVSAAERVMLPLSIELIVENTLGPMESAPPTYQLRTSLLTFAKVIRTGSANAKIGLFTDAGAAVPMIDLNGSAADLDNFIAHFAPVHQGSGALLEALLDAARVLAEEPPSRPRRQIVMIDFAAPDPTTKAEVMNIERAVSQSGATVWSVSVAGSRPETPQREVMLDGLTKDTGGHRQSIVGASGLENQLKVIANSLLSQYTIQIARPAGDRKLLKVETTKGKALFSGSMP